MRRHCHRGCYRFGIGWEIVGIYDNEGQHSDYPGVLSYYYHSDSLPVLDMERYIPSQPKGDKQLTNTAAIAAPSVRLLFYAAALERARREPLDSLPS